MNEFKLINRFFLFNRWNINHNYFSLCSAHQRIIAKNETLFLVSIWNVCLIWNLAWEDRQERERLKKPGAKKTILFVMLRTPPSWISSLRNPSNELCSYSRLCLHEHHPYLEEIDKNKTHCLFSAQKSLFHIWKKVEKWRQ